MLSAARKALTPYVFALVALAIATGIRMLVDPLLGDRQPMVTYFLLATTLALLVEFGPAVMALAIGGMLGRYLFLRPRYRLSFEEEGILATVLPYMVVGLITCGLSSFVRRARVRATEDHEALSREMTERRRVEIELRDREIRSRALIENSSDIVTRIAPDGTVLSISPAVSRVLGYDPEELVGGSGFREVHPDDLEVAASALGEILALPTRGMKVYNLRIRHKDGSWRHLEHVATNLIHEPAVAAVVLNSRDVTERHLMEQQLRKEETRFRAFMENSPAISYVKDESGRYIWGNHAWTTQFRSQGQPLGKTDVDLWPGETAALFQQSDRRALETGRTIEVVENLGDRHFMSLKFPLDFGDERFIGGMTLDVTDRVVAERAVRDREARLHALADSMPQMAWSARPDGQIDWYNRRWFDYTGLTEAESFSYEGWKVILHPEDVARCVETWYNSVRSGIPYEIEYRFRDRSTGSYRWFLGRALPVRDEAGAIVRWYGTCTDIDDQKRAEQAAEAANAAKSRFLAVLSHELRTPLTPVLLSVSSLLESDDHEEVRPVLEMVRRNVTLESRLIDDLLDISRIVVGKLPLHPESCDAHILINQAVEICREELSASKIDLKIDLDARSATVLADPARLQQVFWNLIKNAVKFTPQNGSLAIRSANEGNDLIVEVTDTGIGIEPGFLPRVFDAFEQAEASSWTRRYGGLGLGLAISRSIMIAHGGTLSAESPGVGQGATFRLTLPTRTRAAAPGNGENGKGTGQKPAKTAENLAKSLRILLIEDDASTLSVLSRLLKHNRHEVVTADSVASALSFARSGLGQIDLIISDIGLPDGNGVDLMQTLQSLRPLPAIALTGFGMEEDIQRGRNAGFAAHLVKPIDFRVLEATILSVVPTSS